MEAKNVCFKFKKLHENLQKCHSYCDCLLAKNKRRNEEKSF